MGSRVWVGETALAVAQSVMFNAERDSGLKRTEIAARMGVAPSCVTRMLRGDYNLTVKTLARFLHATGHTLKMEAARG